MRASAPRAPVPSLVHDRTAIESLALATGLLELAAQPHDGALAAALTERARALFHAEIRVQVLREHDADADAARFAVAPGWELTLSGPAEAPDRALAEAFARAAGAAFAHQCRAQQHRRAAERQAALTRAAKTLNESLDLSTLLERICQEAASVLEADSAVVYRVTSGDELAVEAAHGLPPEHIGFRMPAGEGLAGKVLLADRAMMTEDYQRVGRPRAGSPWAAVRGSMAVPVHWGGALRGVLSIAYRSDHRLTPEDLDALESFAELAAVAFANASAHAGLAEAARTDPLTGCLNHAALHESLGREIERAARAEDAPLALVLLDLDRFKEVNDEHGHLVGDEVLRRVGHALRSTTRPYDLAARYGGDEFALIAIGADAEQARDIAARAIERLTISLGDLGGPDGPRATAGVAQWEPGMSGGDLIADADRALLYGKRAARRGEVLTAAELPAGFLPDGREARDRRVPLLTPTPAITWRPSSDELDARLRKRTRQLALASQLGARLAAMTDRDEICDAVVEELHEAFGYFMCAVVRIRDDGHVVSAAQRGEAFLLLGDRNWSQPRDAGLIGRCLRQLAPVRSDDVRQEPEYSATPETADVRSELVVPLHVDGELWGAINIEEVREYAFDDDDVRLLQTVADQVGAALRSAALYERLERAYLGTAEALAAALEAKDAYTADHARSIAELAEGVGRRLGMDEAALRDLRLGAVFHDIGKIAVPEAILNKPGPLTDAERAVMERHTIAGEQILAPVEFLAGVLPLVRHEHERWDGRGYPDGLAGAEIPLGARVIFACDAFHAMTSDRPYRRALPEAVALDELRRHAGTQFDPRVVAALLAELGA